MSDDQLNDEELNDEELKLYKIYKHYHYAEIHYVEAFSEAGAIESLENGLIEGYIEDPDDIFSEFDFYDIMEVKK